MHKYSVNQDGEIQQIANLDPEEKDKIVDMLDINVAVTEGGEVLYINTNIDTDKYSILNTENTTTITENGVKKAIDGVCFIDGEGKLYMCGGIDSVDIPICISDLDNDLKGKNIVDIYDYGPSIMARDSEGKLYTWGYNVSGQLGDGTTEIGYGNYRDEPICISDLDNDLKGKNMVDIFNIESGMFAKDNEGKLYTWGSNEFEQLGEGTTKVIETPICISDNKNSIFFNTEISNYTMIDYAMTSHMLVSDDGKVIYVAWNNAAPN